MTMTRVLFVDDEPAVLSALRRSLHTRDLPWRAEFVTSGGEALDRLKNADFDVIVTDLRMPGMSGQQLLEQVSQGYPQIVQVILSGVDEKELGRGKLNAGPQFLSKPCSSDKLVATIQRAIFLKGFFRRATLNKLVDIFEELNSVSKLQINIRPIDCPVQGDPLGLAEIICLDLGIRFRIPLRRSDRRADPVWLEGCRQ